MITKKEILKEFGEKFLNEQFAYVGRNTTVLPIHILEWLSDKLDKIAESVPGSGMDASDNWRDNFLNNK